MRVDRLAEFVSKQLDSLAEKMTVKQAVDYLGLEEYASGFSYMRAGSHHPI
jgi:hypothetical protein